MINLTGQVNLELHILNVANNSDPYGFFQCLVYFLYCSSSTFVRSLFDLDVY